MSKQSKAGSYYRPMPLDFAILGLLPAKGIIGGVHWAGVPARHVARDINADLPSGADRLGTPEITARLRSMKVAGLIEDFQAVGPMIWARTPEGTDLLARRDEVLSV
jgi:hypothetical protein